MKLIPEEVIKLKVKELRELAKDFPIGKLGSEFITSTFKNGDKTSLTDYEKFLIALQADGTILLENKEEGTNKNRNGNKNGMITVTFTFSKERKIKKLKELLLNLNFTFRETKYKKHFFSIKIPKNLIISKSFKDWVNLNHINYSWAQEFLEELKYWDGWDYNNISFGYEFNIFAAPPIYSGSEPNICIATGCSSSSIFNIFLVF